MIKVLVFTSSSSFCLFTGIMEVILLRRGDNSYETLAPVSRAFLHWENMLPYITSDGIG